MRVSDYLDPVLEAALAHAEAAAIYGDDTINVTVRNRLASQRFAALQAAWAAALAGASAAEAETADADWLAWQPAGSRTAAYRAFAASAAARPETASGELAVLYYDLLICSGVDPDTAPAPVIHPDRINTDLRPAVVSLQTPAMRPAQIGELEAFARARLDAALSGALSDLEVWELYRRSGGDRH